MKPENRKTLWVRMDHPQPVKLMSSDGTWRRSCVLLDISGTGAKVEVEGTLDVLKAKEFFLVLSSTGLAFRRCELVWIDGTTAGIHFIPVNKKAQRKAAVAKPALKQNAAAGR